MKAVSSAQAEQLAQRGYRVWEDRDNFDYLYAREKLATLSGRKLHRKKNLVNLFLRNNLCTAKPLLEEYAGDALRDSGAVDRHNRERPATMRPPERPSRRWRFCNCAAGSSMSTRSRSPTRSGEELAQGRMFVIHFEKAVLKKEYAGIYQYVNQVVYGRFCRTSTS